jgi:tetratricopeptide (TPR) repeat protein
MRCRTHKGRRTPPRAPLPLLLPILALTAGCASTALAPRSFDSATYLRKQYAERLAPETAARLPVAFELEPAILEAAEGRIYRAGSERNRVEQVTDFIFGYAGLDYALTPTRNAVETFRDREGNCLSFVNLFVGLGREFRLAPFYVEVEDYQRWNYSQGTVVSHGHIVAGVRIDGKLETFDFLPYRAKSYRDFNPIDDLKAAAHYFNNLGAEALLRGDLERAQELTEIAVGLAPWFDKALNNLGVALLRQGRTAEAVEVLLRGLERAPESVPLLTNTARAYQELGRRTEADELLARLEGSHLSSPFFFIYRGEAALAQGDLEAALDYMRQALRRDTEVPEVHVGLLKVYLAMGDREKALHHLERALRLDATHEEARKYAAMLLGPAREGR